MDEFGLNDDQLEQELSKPSGSKAKAKKVLDPEEDKANWPTIFVDFEDGKPNYEFLGVSGTMKDGRPFTHTLQIQRGVEGVPVPPSIVNMLSSTKETRFVQSQDPVTGRMNMTRTERAPIPWRLIEKGKYCR
jgi:hypothetical protein